MKYWLCLIDCHYVTYDGFDESTYLIGIYTSEEEAIEASRSQKCKELMAEMESGEDFEYWGGTVDSKVVEFDPSYSNGIDTVLFLGGGRYVE